MNGRRLFIATETFSIDGYQTFTKNQTRVREGHPILDQFPGYFREATADYEWPEVEQATAAPGERRGPGRPRKEEIHA